MVQIPSTSFMNDSATVNSEYTTKIRLCFEDAHQNLLFFCLIATDSRDDSYFMIMIMLVSLLLVTAVISQH